MRWNSLQAVRLAALCLACVLPQTPNFSAQEPNTPPSEIYGPPRFAWIKLQDGATEYADREVGASFTLGRDWRLGNDGLRFLDHGWKGTGDGNLATSVLIRHRKTDENLWLYYCVFRQVHPLTPDQVDRWYDEEVDDKVSERRVQERLKEYRPRPSSYERGEIDGRRTLTWVADFNEGRSKMVEYLVWVRSDRILVEFSIRCPATELDAVRAHVEPVIQSVRIQ